MRIPLGYYDYEKFDAIINGICLSCLFVLNSLLTKSEIPSTFVLLLAVLIIITISMVIHILWTGKAERMLVEGDVKFWTVRRIAISLCFSFACTLAGVFTLVIYTNNNITILMIVVLSGYLGNNVGQIVKFAFRYKLK